MREFLPDKPEHRTVREMKQRSGSGKHEEVALVQKGGQRYLPRPT